MLKYLKANCLVVLACLSLIDVSQAALVTLHHGKTETGRIGEIHGSEFQFFARDVYILNASHITAIEVDPDLSGEALAEDRKNVAKIRLLIDKRNIVVDTLQEQVRQWLDAQDYDALESRADQLTREQTRWEDGSWVIEDFFAALTDDIHRRSVAKINRRLEQLEAWVAARPESGAANLGLIQVLEKKAWAHRGGGYSSTITQDDWKKFRTLIQLAADVTETISAQGYESPMLYANKIWLSNLLGVDKNRLKQLARQSVAAYPDFYPAHTSTYFALLPRWYGEPGELKRFTNVVSFKIMKTHPEAIYLAHRRFYDALEPKKYADINFNWTHIQTGFDSFRKKYYVNDADYHLMAMLACLHGDKEAARRYFAATLGHWNYLSERIWEEQSRLESYRSWAEREDSPQYETIKRTILTSNGPGITRMLRSNPDLIGTFLLRDLYGDTMLHLLVERNDQRILAILADYGIDMESRNASGYTPLQWAVYLGRDASLAALITLGADIESRRGQRGDQAIHIAAEHGFNSTLEILLQQDPEIAASLNHNQSLPLHLAAWNGHIEAVQYLLEQQPEAIDRQDKFLYTPLQYAVQRGYLHIVKYLVDQGANPGLLDNSGYTSLSLARKQRFSEIEAFLRSVGAPDSEVIDTAAQTKRTQEILEQSSQYLNPRDYQKAIEIYRKALAEDPDYSPTYSGLALIAFHFEKDYAKADQYSDKAIELDPDEPENYYWKARANLELGRTDVYPPLFRKYIDMAPDTFNAIDLKQNRSRLLDSDSERKWRKVRYIIAAQAPKVLTALALIGLLVTMLVVVRRRRQS